MGQPLTVSESDIEIIKIIRITGMRESEIVAAKSLENDAWLNISKMISTHKAFLAIGEKHTRQKAIQDSVYGAILLENLFLTFLMSEPQLL